MPTLAQSLGAVEFPVRERSQTTVIVGVQGPQSIDDEAKFMAEMCDLERGILMQSAIGK